MEPFEAYLQELADRRAICTIRFRTVEGGVTEVRAHILSFETLAGRPMVETDAGFHIGVDQILQVNDRLRSDLC